MLNIDGCSSGPRTARNSPTWPFVPNSEHLVPFPEQPVPNPTKPRFPVLTMQLAVSPGVLCHALLSSATAESRIADTFRSGKNTAKQVPLRPGCVLLRTRIQPPCLSTIPLVTQRPRPVPFSPFVVKNGSNILRRFSRETPGPLSAMKTRTPRLVGFLQSPRG